MDGGYANFINDQLQVSSDIQVKNSGAFLSDLEQFEVTEMILSSGLVIIRTNSIIEILGDCFLHGGTFVVESGAYMNADYIESDTGTLSISGNVSVAGQYWQEGILDISNSGSLNVFGLFRNYSPVIIDSGILDVNGGLSNFSSIIVDDGATVTIK